jgi:hypothetical protein
LYKRWADEEERQIREVLELHDWVLPPKTIRWKIAKSLNRGEKSVRDKMYAMGAKKLSDVANAEEAKENEEIKRRVLEWANEYEPINYEPLPLNEINVELPLEAIRHINTGRAPKLHATVVMSDVHLGDSNHLPKTYWSTMANLKEVFAYLTQNFVVDNFDLVLNGDIVAGQGIFYRQEYRNLVDRGHWQVHLAYQIVQETVQMLELSGIKSNIIHINRGTHDPVANNYAIFLTDMWPKEKALYHGRESVINVAGDLGYYNVMFTHGMGSSDYSPISPKMTREMWMSVQQKDVPIERVCVAHTHSLASDVPKTSVIFDVTGGFQLYEPRLARRRSGILLYLYTCQQFSVSKIKPDPKVYKAELADGLLEWKNMRYYANKLLKHAKMGFK